MPRRTVGRQICDAGAVTVNQTRARGSRNVKPGDTISIKQRGRITIVRVLEIPLRPPPKALADSMYETISVEAYDQPD